MRIAALLFVIGLIGLTSFEAHAVNKYRGERYTCQQLKWLVKKEKVILVESGWWGGYFASKKHFCPTGHNASNIAYFSVKNGETCGLGFYCRPRLKDWPE